MFSPDHMLKLFDNVKSVEFSRNKRNVLAMNDPKGEKFDFCTPSVIEGPVETWMARPLPPPWKLLCLYMLIELSRSPNGFA